MNNPNELIDLVRRLETKELLDLDKEQLRTITDTIKKDASHSNLFDKIHERAMVIDNDGRLQQSLDDIYKHIHWVCLAWLIGYFVMGIIATIGLFTSDVINFFYALTVLLGWHSLTLILWLSTQKSGKKLGLSGQIFESLTKNIKPKDPIDQHAFAVIMDSKKDVWQWYVAKLMHQAWLMFLVGSGLSLFGLFLFQKYVFVWESTLLNEQHIITLIHLIGYLPSKIFGITLPTSSNFHHSDLAYLVLASLLLYGFIPRILAWAYCAYKARHHFAIDSNLYYYENLTWQFNTQTLSEDDFVQTTPTPIKAVIGTERKIIATLESTWSDRFWFQFGAGSNIKEFGVVDSNDDLLRLQSQVELLKAMVYLGIDSRILPDRGVVRKLEKIAHIAEFGLAVELLGDGTHKQIWQQHLSELGIAESRY